MAKQLKDFKFGIGNSGKKYPWDTWFNGKIWELKKGEDFFCSTVNFRSTVYAAAARRGLKVVSKVLEDKKETFLVFKSSKMEG